LGLSLYFEVITPLNPEIKEFLVPNMGAEVFVALYEEIPLKLEAEYGLLSF